MIDNLRRQASLCLEKRLHKQEERQNELRATGLESETSVQMCLASCYTDINICTHGLVYICMLFGVPIGT